MKNLSFDSLCKYNVSYVFATKNRSEQAKKTLNVISKNITKNDELICINGGKDDGLKKYISNLKITNFKYVNESDFSDLHAWNKSFLLSQGRIIKNICDDDEYNWKNLKKSIQILLSDKNLDCIFTGGKKINLITKEETFINLPSNLNFWHDNLENLFNYSISGTGLILKRSLFAKIGQLWLEPVNEVNLLISCFNNKKVKVRYLRANTYTHYFHADSVSNLNSQIKRKFMLRQCFNNCSFKFFIKTYLRQSFLSKIKRHIFPNKNRPQGEDLAIFDWKLL